MDTETKEQVKGPEAHQEPAKPEEKGFTMPGLDKGPASFYDPESKAFWVGIPLDKIDFMTAVCVIDSVKLNLLQQYQAEAVRQAKASKIVKPTWAEKAKQNGAALIQRLTQ